MTKINLSIPFDNEDELLPLKIKWDNELETWYFDGDVLPKELEPYTSKYLNIRYEDVDECKERYKSISFDKVKNIYKISQQDYNKMTNTRYSAY